MLENFERFTKTGRSFKPKISIRKRGYVGFSKGAIQRFNLKNFDYAVLFISKDRSKIAMMFTNDPDEKGAIKLVKRPSNFAFSAKAFLDYYDINYEDSKTYIAKWNQDDKVAVIDLEESQLSRGGNSS